MAGGEYTTPVAFSNAEDVAEAGEFGAGVECGGANGGYGWAYHRAGEAGSEVWGVGAEGNEFAQFGVEAGDVGWHAGGGVLGEGRYRLGETGSPGRD